MAEACLAGVSTRELKYCLVKPTFSIAAYICTPPVYRPRTTSHNKVGMTESLQTSANSYPEFARFLVSGWSPGKTLASLRATTPLTKKPEDSGYEIETSATIFYFTIPPMGRNNKPSRVWVARDQLNPG